MADASGTPTSPDNIPTYATSADPPSGKGFNTAMAQIQQIITQLKAGTLASGKIAIAGLTGYPADASKFLRGDGSWASPTSSPTLAYAELNTTATTTATTEAGATTLITAGAVTFDGATPVVVDIFIPGWQHTVTDGRATLVLFDSFGSASVGHFGTEQAYKANDSMGHLTARRKLTPVAGAHTFSAQAYTSSGTATFLAGAGGNGNLMPAYLLVSRA